MAAVQVPISANARTERHRGSKAAPLSLRKRCEIFRRFRSDAARGEIYCADALALLKVVPDECADLVFLDPPFNLGKKYGRRTKLDKRSPEDYFEWLSAIVSESVRILTPGGALFLYHLPVWAMRVGPLLQDHLALRHWIAISMKNGFARGDRLYPAHYALLYFTKGSPKTFSRPKLTPQKCKACGESVKDYGGYAHIIEKKGINLSDVWDDLSPVRHHKHRRANQLPLTLTRRVAQISGRKGELLVDPFAGTGSMVVAAAATGMRFIAGDLVRSNCQIMADRLMAMKQETRAHHKRVR